MATSTGNASTNPDNQALIDQVNLMKLQLMTANEEKRRHLEENSNDKMMYEKKIASM